MPPEIKPSTPEQILATFPFPAPQQRKNEPSNLIIRLPPSQDSPYYNHLNGIYEKWLAWARNQPDWELIELDLYHRRLWVLDGGNVDSKGIEKWQQARQRVAERIDNNVLRYWPEFQ